MVPGERRGDLVGAEPLAPVPADRSRQPYFRRQGDTVDRLRVGRAVAVRRQASILAGREGARLVA